MAVSWSESITTLGLDRTGSPVSSSATWNQERQRPGNSVHQQQVPLLAAVRQPLHRADVPKAASNPSARLASQTLGRQSTLHDLHSSLSRT
jgi:hypothetical protein